MMISRPVGDVQPQEEEPSPVELPRAAWEVKEYRSMFLQLYPAAFPLTQGVREAIVSYLDDSYAPAAR